MTQPPSSPPDHPEPSEQPLFPPTYPEQKAPRPSAEPPYPDQPAPTYPRATQPPPQYPNPPRQPQHRNTPRRPDHPGFAEPPTYPGSAEPPSYPDAGPHSQRPTYPGSAEPPTYPGTPQQPQYPSAAQRPDSLGFAEPPTYPGSAEPPTYPDATPKSQHPNTARPPTYPDASPQAQPPAYPGSAEPPTYPGTPQQPLYPNAGGPPTYPGATPTPAYPGAAPAQSPPYPQATAQPVPPQYTPPQQAPTTPTPPAPTPAPAAPSSHPHHISTDRQRVHISAHQRRTDATAVGNLLLYLPNFLCSLLVVSMFSLFFGDLAFLVIIAWILSGALVFHRPTESALARRLLHLRYPTPQERAKLEPVWHEVTARAGVMGRNYELWVEDSDGLNAVAAAGHIVGVTRYAMNELPNGELAAVMAHELGHHVGGHAWSGLLGYWYAQPGRIAWRFLRAFSGFVFQVSRAFSCFGIGFVVLVLGGIAMATISTLYGLPLLILGVPYALAAVGRRAELRADEHAAALGFAPMLASVLGKLHQEEQRQTAALAALNNGVAPEESPLRKLLSSHPDYHTRLHHLQPYLQQQR
ncbi:M48 family metalloprotease [Streptomyces sp. AK08-02]|uniref:M48 family metalloprotease n=1 Tax=Streptomyces sp. AK08-02 TaxID=3028654 RepID=UPI0029B256C2|nr:M48 family metalloprotease [Streptomyces sp. AK08-02]MDX3747720.1 M48 family metalloprotease [Streptomyces sp. AK08-02]